MNVRNLVNNLGLELRTVVIDWEEMRELQLAFLRSGTLNQDIPQDHAFFTSLYRIAINENIPHVLSGVNFATESVEPLSWGYSYLDRSFIRSVFRKNGSGRLRKYPIITMKEYRKLLKGERLQVFEPLNFQPYNPSAELESLVNEIGWEPYGEKHGESIFTSWFQENYLPERYGILKSRAHLSSRVISGLISRAEALHLLEEKAHGSRRLDSLVIQKLRISLEELNDFVKLDHCNHTHYDKLWKKFKRGLYFSNK
jgi:hypothetical protein